MVVALLDLVVVAGLVQWSLALFASVTGTWIPFALILAITWAIGEWRWMAPGPAAAIASAARPQPV